jgi:hypothetical protein
MVLYEVFSHAKYTRYKTNIFSKASLVQLITITLALLSPFLIAYFTGGIYITSNIKRMNLLIKIILSIKDSGSMKKHLPKKQTLYMSIDT